MSTKVNLKRLKPMVKQRAKQNIKRVPAKKPETRFVGDKISRPPKPSQPKGVMGPKAPRRPGHRRIK